MGGTALLAFLLALSGMLVRGAEARELRIRTPLHEGWQFRQVGTQRWYPAEVPGCVHTDLLRNGLLPDPFFRDNEAKVQWVGKTDWEYELRFSVPSVLLDREQIELVCEGLDTYADVWLNGVRVLRADNMFRTWRVPVKRWLAVGENILRVVFRSPINEVLPKMKDRKVLLPAANDQGEKTSPYTRKAPYHFGWDWGPRLVTCGIWRPIYLLGWDTAVLRSVYFVTASLAEDTAVLTVQVEVEVTQPGHYRFEVRSPEAAFSAQEQHVDLPSGVQTVSVPVRIDRPRLWWPNGYGEQYLYRVEVTLSQDSRLLDRWQGRLGLRSLELRQKEDPWGRSFEFVVNGVPIFAKGGNWIPADNFPTRVTSEKYRWLLESCRAANMNMLRVWGGGVYEDEVFYDLCDELGLLVWQDFMFACSLYPGDEAFMESVRLEATDQVKRLRNHPCLALWCGNNEIEAGWFEWGWKQQYPASCWEDYRKLFYSVLPEVIREHDPQRPYWPSSPSSNLEDLPQSERMGDVHYWMVWHGGLPFEAYLEQHPRFMSEYGFQSFPLLETVKAFTLPQDWDIESPVMLVHQKHPRGNRLIREYMERDWPVPRRFEDFLVMSQIVQAEGIKLGAEHLRRIRPRCMGSLYWQIDDCWPVASWSSIDYFGRWKALHYYAARFYAPILVSPYVQGEKVHVYVVNDRREPFRGQLRTAVHDFATGVVHEEVLPVAVPPGSSTKLTQYDVPSLLSGTDARRSVLLCEVLEDGTPISQNTLLFVRPKELILPPAELTLEVSGSGQRPQVKVLASAFAKSVFLLAPGFEGRFSDNYFDVFPGRPVAVDFIPRGAPVDLEAFRRALTVRSLVDLR
ncbi:MAG: hypothetical protein ONB23_03155 [candidate division KSB1 bacterium]|nr:hypothetical protein [candidate division KSB1 bacterium]